MLAYSSTLLRKCVSKAGAGDSGKSDRSRGEGAIRWDVTVEGRPRGQEPTAKLFVSLGGQKAAGRRVEERRDAAERELIVEEVEEKLSRTGKERDAAALPTPPVTPNYEGCTG